ncbi:hypothetical protein [Streptomyces sp. NBC_01446]|uniref:hypothetical protein n=1 Tax=Streptomyces sp. NBC_01446 TaxID=2903870 RepID=UPI002B1CAB2C|nr:hypothetical protein [Streptomyces sp. NBC_01446]
MATSERPVVIYPPDENGGRRLRVDGSILGRAFTVRDVVAFMQEAGLQEWDEIDVVRTSLIDRRGGGPDHADEARDSDAGVRGACDSANSPRCHRRG